MTLLENLTRLCADGNCSAAQFLALMESETDDALDQAFEYFTENRIVIDLSDLPKFRVEGAAGSRLRREEDLAKLGDLLSALAEKCAAGDENAPERLVNAMLGSVIAIAREFTGRGVLLLDLCQEGGLALWQAILSYEVGDFETLCKAQIRQAMAMACLAQAFACGIGEKLQSGMEDYRDMDQQLLSELGRNPTVAEIAQRLHIPEDEAQVLKNALDNAHKRKAVDDAREEKEPDPDEEQAVENTAYWESRQRIMELLSTLSEADAKLISLRFGLEGGLPLTPEQTAQRLGLTPEEVLEKESAALTALRGETQNG